MGGLLYTYQSGTTTPLQTFTDATGTTANSNPVGLNGSGGASVWLVDEQYTFVLKDSNNNVIWTENNIVGIGADGGQPSIAVDSGTSNLVQLTAADFSGALTNALGFIFTKNASNNSGAVQVTVNGGLPVALVYPDGSALYSNTLLVGVPYEIIYSQSAGLFYLTSVGSSEGFSYVAAQTLKTGTLSTTGNANIAGSLAAGSLDVTGNAVVDGSLSVGGAPVVTSGNLSQYYPQTETLEFSGSSTHAVYLLYAIPSGGKGSLLAIGSISQVTSDTNGQQGVGGAIYSTGSISNFYVSSGLAVVTSVSGTCPVTSTQSGKIGLKSTSTTGGSIESTFFNLNLIPSVLVV